MSATRGAAAALASALALVASPGAALGRAVTPARVRTMQAFVLSSAPDSLRDLRAHARSIGIVYPTYFQCASGSGALTGAADPALTQYARSQRMAVMPRFNCQEGATVHAILTEPNARAATLARLAAIAGEAQYAGIDVDFENDGAADRQAMTAFVAALAERVHALHKKLSVVVDGVGEDDASRSTGFYDDRALVQLADTVFVLAWGAHWQGSTPGPIAPLASASATASYLSSLPDSSRFVLGAPMYGLDWPDGGGPAHEATAYQYANVLALAHAQHAHVARDGESGELTFSYTDAAGVPHEVWCMDATSVIALLAIARAHGLQTGVWRLGEEDQALWSSSLTAPRG